MKEIVPKYYHKFKCIADKCKHSCCAGWEIDIDIETLERYNHTGGKFGERFKNNISDGPNAHFILTEDEKCPFLNKNGLCDIISEYGESALCQICADHPRFRNFYSSHIEMGLGLCCEAVTDIILTSTEKFTIEIPQIDDEQEKFFFKFRTTVLDILQDRDFSFDERIENLLILLNTQMPVKSYDEYKSLFLSLEIMDDSWKEALSDAVSDNSKTNDMMYEQLICYFVFRHLFGALYDGEYIARIKLCILFCEIIAMIVNAGHNIFEICRLFSAEIEYSDVNIQTILESLL